MSVLRYCCFRWLVYDRALVFEPSRPLACIMMLVRLIYVFRVVLRYLPVSPWSWSYMLRAWLVYDWIEGVTSWYQGRLLVGIPLSNSLAEVESSIWKTVLLTWMCGLRAHVAIWVVLGSFIPRPILWDSDLSSIWVKMNLLTLTLGSRNYFHPKNPLLHVIASCTRRFRRYSSIFSRDFVPTAFAIPDHR